MRSYAVIAAVAAVAVAQNLGPCAQMCADNMALIANTQYSCAAGDIACFCGQSNWAFGIRDCSAQACGAAEAAEAVTWAAAQCGNVAVSGTVPAALPILTAIPGALVPSVTARPSSEAPGITASATIVASSIQSEASSIGASVSSALASANSSASSAFASASSSIHSNASVRASATGSQASVSGTAVPSETSAAGAAKMTGLPIAGAAGIVAWLLL